VPCDRLCRNVSAGAADVRPSRRELLGIYAITLRLDAGPFYLRRVEPRRIAFFFLLARATATSLSDSYEQDCRDALETVRQVLSSPEENRPRTSLSFEFKFSPQALARKPTDLRSILIGLITMRQWVEEVFFEVPFRNGFDLDSFATPSGIATYSGKPWALKFRAGGATVDTVPGAKHFANAIRLCRDHNIRWKATAGLHQPLRHFEESIGTFAHGFLNLLCAAVLARARRMSEAEIADVLKKESLAAFEFSDDCLRWRDFTANVAEIWAARKASMISFGSCSFEEPLEGLRALELVE
jgi:hypothetical protein